MNAAGRRLFVALIAMAGIFAGCQKELSPVLPDAPVEGVYIYSEPNYSGHSAQLLRSVYDLYEYKGPCGIDYPGTDKSWSDCIQSIKVTPGWQTTLYADRQYGGKSLQLTADAPDLGKVAGPCNGSWTRCVGSIFVARQQSGLGLSASAARSGWASGASRFRAGSE